MGKRYFACEMLGTGWAIVSIDEYLGNRIGDPSVRSKTLGSSACICWRNRIRVGFIFRPSFLLFLLFSILCNLCPLFGHFILHYMARDHAES